MIRLPEGRSGSDGFAFSTRRAQPFSSGERSVAMTQGDRVVRNERPRGVATGDSPVRAISRQPGAASTALVPRERTRDFYAGGLDRRIEYPGVPRPRPRGILVDADVYRRPVICRGRPVVACVPRWGFGFLTPITVVDPYPYPYPIYGPPMYSSYSTTIINPPPMYDEGYYGGGEYYAPPPYGTAGPYPAGDEYSGPQQGAGAPPQQAFENGPMPEQPEGEGMPQDGVQPPVAEPPPPPAEGGPEASSGRREPQSEDRIQRLMREGMEAFTAGDYDQSGRMFLQAGMANPDNIDAWLAYAVARFATRDYEASALAVRRGVRAMPDVASSPINIRERYGRPDDFDRHLASLESHVRVQPEDAEAWLVLGFVRHFSQQRELAAKTFEVIDRRFETDRDIAQAFLKAKPVSESQAPTGAPGSLPPEGEPSGDPRSTAPTGMDPAIGEALADEQELQDAGLAGTPIVE